MVRNEKDRAWYGLARFRGRRHYSICYAIERQMEANSSPSSPSTRVKTERALEPVYDTRTPNVCRVSLGFKAESEIRYLQASQQRSLFIALSPKLSEPHPCEQND